MDHVGYFGVASDDDDDDNDDENNVATLNNCDPTAGWSGPGCIQKKGEDDDVTPAEFDALLPSPLSASVVGHPSWRNDPSYLSIRVGERVHVKNRGGRPHTFTKVVNFGGGVIPPLNAGLGMAPECPLDSFRTSETHLGARVDGKFRGNGSSQFQDGKVLDDDRIGAGFSDRCESPDRFGELMLEDESVEG